MKKLLIALSVVFSGVSCTSPDTSTRLESRNSAVYTSRHFQREILLSKVAPENKWCGVSLQSISRDGAVALLVLSSGKTLTALKGDYFESEEFGRRGLELKEVDQQNYSAVLIRTWSE